MGNLQDVVHQYTSKLTGSILVERQNALQRLLQYGLPSKKFENFKYTSFTNFSDNFAANLEATLREPNVAADISLSVNDKEEVKNLIKTMNSLIDCHLIVFVNGVLFSTDDEIKNHIDTLSLVDYVEKNKKFLEEIENTKPTQENKKDLSVRLRLATKPKHQGLECFNYAVGTHFYNLQITTSLKKPLRVVYMTSAKNVSPTSLNITVGERVTCQIIESHYALGSAEENSLQLTYSNLRIENQADVLHIIENEMSRVSLYARRQTVVQNQSIYDQCFMQNSLKVTRQESDIHFVGEKAEVQSLACGVGQQTSHTDYYLSLYHHKGHNNSVQYFKNLLNDKAVSIFRGLVYMAPHAQGANSEQLNNNLLLSETAEAISLPQLEIYVDDVKAAHGSTVGELNVEEVFYLQSRGIHREKAVEMLSSGFIKEVIYKLKQTVLNEYLLERLEKNKNA